MHDETVNPSEERAFAAFLDRLANGEPGDAGVDPTLAETARDLHDRAARSTLSAPPAGTLATIRADLFGAPATTSRHRTALGILPNALLVTRPAIQVALAAAILLAVITGFAAFRSAGWLGHVPTSTHSALAASATAPITTAHLAMSPDNGSGIESAFVVPDPSTCTVAPRSVEQIQTIDARKSGSESSLPLPVNTSAAGTRSSANSAVAGSGGNNLGGRDRAVVPTPTPIYLSDLPAGTPADAATVQEISDTVGEIYGCLKADKRLQVYALFTDAGLARFPAPSLLFAPGILEGPGERTAFKIASASVLPDGRVVAKLAFQVSEGIYNETWIFAPGTDGYLVDQMNPTETPPATVPLAVTHASLPSTPIVSPESTLSPEAQSLVQTCPMSTGTVIPDASPFFTPWGLGEAPVWLDGWGQPPKEVQDRYPSGSVPAIMGADFAGPTWQGWSTPARWIMDGRATEPVTIVGTRISDNALVWFSQETGHSTTYLQLDPTQPVIPVQHGSFREWPTAITFPGTGCYEITATWRGGSWTERVLVYLPQTDSTPKSTPVYQQASPSSPSQPPPGSCAMPVSKPVDIPMGSGGQFITAWGMGNAPLWLVGLGAPPPWYQLPDAGFIVSGSYEPPATVMPPGNVINVLWLMDPNRPQQVTVRGHNVDNGSDLLFQGANDRQPAKETTFRPGPGAGKGTVHMWWTSVIYTQPGCYEITASWASGSWTVRVPLPAPTSVASPPICATPVVPGSPANPVQSLLQPPPLQTVQPQAPHITPGIQQIATRPGLPLITPTPFATIVSPGACDGS